MNDTTKGVGVIALVSLGVCLAYNLGKSLGIYAKSISKKEEQEKKEQEKKEQEKKEQEKKEQEKKEQEKKDLELVMMIRGIADKWLTMQNSEITLEQIETIEKEFEFFVSTLPSKRSDSIEQNIQTFRKSVEGVKFTLEAITSISGRCNMLNSEITLEQVEAIEKEFECYISTLSSERISSVEQNIQMFRSALAEAKSGLKNNS